MSVRTASPKPILEAAHSNNRIANAMRLLVTIGVLPILLVVMAVIFGLIEPRFLNPANLMNILRQATFLVIVAMGQMLALISAGFDLSVGAIVALTSVIAALVMVYMMGADGTGSPMLALIAGCGAGLLAGLGFGLLNGLGVAVLKVSPFIVTLGTSSAIAGIALLLTGGAPVVGLPPLFVENFGSGRIFGVPTVIYITIVIVGIMYYVMNWSRFGRYVYAIGGNEVAARLSGIRVGRYLTNVYVVSGLLASTAGLLLTARVSAGEPNLGGPFAMQSITAAVLGGTSLRGGEGSLGGVILGALFIAMLANGMNLIRVSSFWQMILLGCLLVFAVVFDRVRSKLARAAAREK
ncbi:ABC transporter permease [Mesorhizobium sp. WSM4976]|uniref:ABC transporter permease n=1 Tax=Mesorhizobium sp. WSM4976 TaxID=3038549 RepID=UPI002416F21B|nr:ABC transporter permease [Mesorhizobium sp. WSM4976]MDG4898389.1 ABC transporter permease [Mesorhizobium sp. WSM4976]